MEPERKTADVSVVIPVKDCAPYLAQCLDSVLAQTTPPRQVLCADDGSTDSSLDILKEYAARDDRIEVMRFPDVGPGAARNACLDRAVGRYVAFLDADDFFEPTLLEQACAKADEDESDIVAWDVWYYNDRFGHRQHPDEGVLSFGKLDEGGPFSWRANPDWIFLSFQSWAWNKLFRREFLERERIRFQDIRRSEDVVFSCTALAAAQRISCLYDRLTNYRVARDGSAMATKDRHALDFMDAMEALRGELSRRGLEEPLHRAYVGFAASSCLYNLQTLRTLPAARQVFGVLKEGGFERLGIDLSDDESFVDVACQTECLAIKEGTFEEYSFRRSCALERAREDAAAVCDHVSMDSRALAARKDEELAAKDAELGAVCSELAACEAEVERLQGEADGLRQDIARLGGTLDELTHCAEWRVGVALGKIPRAIQRKVLAARERRRS